METEFPPDHAVVSDGVAFHALVDGQSVVCIATATALQLIDQSFPNAAILARFRGHVGSLREVTEILILGGRVSQGRLVISQTEPCRSPASASARSGPARRSE